MKKRKFIILIIFGLLSYFNVKAQDWNTDYKKAFEQAREQNKKVLLVFSGSDWCVPCIKLEKEIWSSDYFKNNYKEHFVLLRADFPRRKKNQLPESQREKNAYLAEKYNPNGLFPLVLVLDADGNVMGKAGYEKKSPEEYFNKLISFE